MTRFDKPNKQPWGQIISVYGPDMDFLNLNCLDLCHQSLRMERQTDEPQSKGDHISTVWAYRSKAELKKQYLGYILVINYTGKFWMSKGHLVGISIVFCSIIHSE